LDRHCGALLGGRWTTCLYGTPVSSRRLACWSRPITKPATIADSIRSLLQLSYTGYEIIVINDGSSDSTLEVLTREFALRPFPEVYQASLVTAPIRSIYVSQTHDKLRVIDKETMGGRPMP
jgi:hypothetical protein